MKYTVITLVVVFSLGLALFTKCKEYRREKNWVVDSMWNIISPEMEKETEKPAPLLESIKKHGYLEILPYSPIPEEVDTKFWEFTLEHTNIFGRDEYNEIAFMLNCWMKSDGDVSLYGRLLALGMEFDPKFFKHSLRGEPLKDKYIEFRKGKRGSFREFAESFLRE